MKRIFTTFLLSIAALVTHAQFVGVNPAAAPTLDGVISAGEYGTFTNNVVNGFRMVWDDTYLYIAKTGGATDEGIVVYLDTDPIGGINDYVSGGSDVVGSLNGFNYDGIAAKLPFRSDIVLYFKDTYGEFRNRDGLGGFGTNTVAVTSGITAATPFARAGNGTGPVSEIRLRWDAIAGISSRPAAFNWFGYQASGTQFIFDETPARNPDGNFSAATPYFNYYQTINNSTNTGTTRPFQRLSYENREGNDYLDEASTYYHVTKNIADDALVIGSGSELAVNGYIKSKGGVDVEGTLTLNSSATAYIDGDTLSIDGSLTTGTAGGVLLSNGSILLNTGGSFALNGSFATASTTNFVMNGGLFTRGATATLNYNFNSNLVYNAGGSYNRGSEWYATSGSGYPGNVVVSGNTVLNVATSGEGESTNVPRQIQSNLVIENGSTITLNSLTSDFTVLGNITNFGVIDLSSVAGPGGGIVINGPTFVNTGGTISADGKRISFDGTVAQQIIGTTVFNDLQISNSAGVTVSSGITTVLERLSLDDGVFTTNGSLVLGSNAAKTGMIHSDGGSISGNVTVQQYITNGAASGYHTVSSPVSGESFADFGAYLHGGSIVATHPFSGSAGGAGNTTQPFPNIFQYDETLVKSGTFEAEEWGWNTPASTGTTMTPGVGVLARIPLNSTIEFTGTINDGPYSVGLSNTAGTTGSGWNLLGNPYPSPIDWDNIVTLNATEIGTTILGSVYAYESTSSYGGGYGSYNGFVSTGGFNSTGLIAAKQGFFVRVTAPGATPSLSFNNTIRNTSYVPPSTVTLLRERTEFKEGFLRLEIHSGTEARPTKDDLVVYMESGASEEFDVAYDANKFMYNDIGWPTMFTRTKDESEKLSINVMNPLKNSEDRVIPVTLWIETSKDADGEYLQQELLASELGGFDVTTEIFLEDRWNEQLINLSENPSYTFTADKGHQENRFYIHLRNGEVTSLIDDLASENAKVWMDNGTLQVQFATSSNEESTIAIYNLAGQQIYTFKGKANGSRLSTVLPDFEAKMVIVKIEREGNITNQKLYID